MLQSRAQSSDLRGQIDDLSRENAWLLTTSVDGAALSDPPGQNMQLALKPYERFVVEGALRANPDVGRRFDRTITELGGGSIAPQELPRLKDRILDKARMDEIKALNGIYMVDDKPPVYVTPEQKTVIDGLAGRLGDDDLARRTRSAYDRSIAEGRVRVRRPPPRR